MLFLMFNTTCPLRRPWLRVNRKFYRSPIDWALDFRVLTMQVTLCVGRAASEITDLLNDGIVAKKRIDSLAAEAAKLSARTDEVIAGVQAAERTNAAGFREAYRLLGIEDDGEYRWKWVTLAISKLCDERNRLALIANKLDPTADGVSAPFNEQVGGEGRVDAAGHPTQQVSAGVCPNGTHGGR